ncbi:MAG: hypothetical protein ABIP93_13105 [Gemmatimonadaceae bacterium]
MSFRLEHSTERTVVRDTPQGMWAFGAAFVMSGLTVLLGGVGSDKWPEFPLWVRAVILAIGLSHLIAGCYWVWRYEATVTTFDHVTGDGTHAVRRPFRRDTTVRHFRVADVQTIELRRHADSEGDPMYQLHLWLAESRVLPLQGAPAHNIPRGERNAAALREALRLPARA